MKQSIKKTVEAFATKRKNEGRPVDKTLINITYFILKKHMASFEEMDNYAVSIIYDNLYINNQFIDKYNLDEYDDQTLKEILKDRFCNMTVDGLKKKVLQDNKIIMLDYYGGKNAYRLYNCFICFDPNYNVLKSECL